MYSLNMLCYVLLPVYSFDIILKYMRVKLDKRYDDRLHEKIRDNLRGGINTAVCKHDWARNKCTEAQNMTEEHN